MKINEFIKNNLDIKVIGTNQDPSMKHIMTSTRLPHIVCTDGFTMSVQVGYSLYCKPKNVAKRYSEVEIGYPSEREPLLEKYVESFFVTPDFTDSIYPYVPVKVVDKILKKHGGIDLTETLRRYREWTTV